MLSTDGRHGILLLSTFLQGGAGRAIVDLATGLQQSGRRVAVVASQTPVGEACNYPEYLDQLRASGVDLLLLDSTFSRDRHSNVEAAAAIGNELALEDFSVVHAHASTPARIGFLLASRASHSLTVVQTMHGWGVNKTAEHESQDVATMNRVARVITTSRTSADDIIARGVSDLRIVTIPCGIEETGPQVPTPPTFKPIVAARERGMAVVACIGSLTKFKNQRLVIEALPRVGQSANVGAVFVGEGSKKIEILRALAAERGVSDRVWFLGYQPTAASLLPHVDLLAQASTTEGQGVAILEAMRARVPTVASDIPVFRELIVDGQTGFLFTSNNPDALASSILRALWQPKADRAALTDRAYAFFRHRYTVSAMQRSHDALYDLVVKTTTPQLGIRI